MSKGKVTEHIFEIEKQMFCLQYIKNCSWFGLKKKDIYHIFFLSIPKRMVIDLMTKKKKRSVFVIFIKKKELRK